MLLLWIQAGRELIIEGLRVKPPTIIFLNWFFGTLILSVLSAPSSHGAGIVVFIILFLAG
jgi:hypothetical protein